jgi:hypothetical protein
METSRVGAITREEPRGFKQRTGTVGFVGFRTQERFRELRMDLRSLPDASVYARRTSPRVRRVLLGTSRSAPCF